MSEYDEGMERAYATSNFALNDIFVIQVPPIRIGAVRLSVSELVWMLLTAATVTGLGYLIHFKYLMKVSPEVFEYLSLAPTALGIMAGIFIGRPLAKMSPYASRTGESTLEYIKVQLRRRFLMGDFRSKKTMNYVSGVSYVTGRRQNIECVKWIGTMRSPVVPHNPDKPVRLDRRYRLTPYIDEKREKERLQAARIEYMRSRGQKANWKGEIW